MRVVHPERLLVAALFGVLTTPCWGATLVAEPFDSLSAWQVRTVGPATVHIVQKGLYGKGVRVDSRGGLAFCCRALPLDAVRGCQLTVRCMAKVDYTQLGPQACSAPKIHLAVATPRGVLHFSSRFTRPSDWHEESFTADVPNDASKVLLTFGVENAAASVAYDSLIVETNKKGVVCIDIRNVANGSFAELSSGSKLPTGRVAFDGIPFNLIDPSLNHGKDCVVLRGLNQEALPETTREPIRVGSAATAIYLLHVAIGGAEMRETPCLIWTVRFWDGNESSFSVFEGREIGPLCGSKDLENWRIVWRGKTAAGKPVVLGMTKWPIYSTLTPVESLIPRVYVGAAPLLVAVTVVNEPPKPATEEETGGWEVGWDE